MHHEDHRGCSDDLDDDCDVHSENYEYDGCEDYEYDDTVCHSDCGVYDGEGVDNCHNDCDDIGVMTVMIGCNSQPISAAQCK